MAETLSTSGSVMDMALKDNGIIVDMSPSALLHHNTLAAAAALRTFNEATAAATSDDQNSMTETANTPTNLSSASSPPLATFRCERCDNFETSSRATLLLHVVQCLAAGGQSARMKTDEHEPENMSVNHMAEQQQKQQSGISATDTTSSGLMVTPVMNNGNNGSVHPPASSSSSSSSPAASNTSNSNATNAARKVFECDVCNMKFSNGANMRRHKMRHTGVKPYECRVCQKRFFRKDHLAEHFTTHTKTLPYHCPICNRGFQRQIAMRAHFQNEHVGQHDLVKTCPLCSYRAGSMKSLRIHFFNRHGIDLDNPGPGGTSSLLLALESQASQVAAAAAAAGFVPGLSPVAAAAAAGVANNVNNVPPSHQSDSGESLRSLENATPPMHFLTPHVEISTLSENGAPEMFNVTQDSSNITTSVQNAVLCVLRDFALQGNTVGHALPGNDTLDAKVKERALTIQSPVALGAPQDLPMDCNAKTSTVPSSTSSSVLHSHNHSHNGKSLHHENHITPSISLIPIKQEPMNEEQEKSTQKDQGSGGDGSDTDFSTPNNRATSLIKVSPLKSLLREDLKRRICAKANHRITRNAAALENNNVLPNVLSTSSTTPPNSATSTPICNGTITSTGQESELMLTRKQILTCHFCGIEFPDETLYFLHKGCHCDSNPWKCNICGEQCNNVYEFNSHLLSKSHQ